MKKPIILFISLMIVSSLYAKQDSISKPVTLYFKNWIPETRELEGGLNKEDIKGVPHIKVMIGSTGLVRKVKLVNKAGEDYLSYHLVYNRNHSWAKYWIEALVDTPLTVISDLLIAHDLSDLRKGYKITVKDRKNGDIESLQVYDNLSSFLYFYEFDYSSERNDQIITSSYFKYDSTRVGYHTLKYDKTGRLRSIDYFDNNDNVKYSLGYNYYPGSNEVSRSIIDETGTLLEKRILPFSSKYLRKPIRKKQGLSLSEVIDYLEGAKKDDIDALASFLEQRYRIEINRVDTTYSPILNVVDTLIIEKESEPDKKIVPRTVKRTKTRHITFGAEAGASIFQGSFIGTTVPTLNMYLGTAKTFKFIVFPLRPYLDLNIYNISKKNYTGIKLGLVVPGELPFGIPFELNGGIGTNQAGGEITAGLMFYRQRAIKVGLKFETHVFPNILLSNKSTGWASVKLVLGI